MLIVLHLLIEVMSINKRVEQLVEKTSRSKSAFSIATGISTVILSHISSGRNKVSLTAVEQILKAFPSVSSDWLVLGKGSMFKDALGDDKASELQDNLGAIEQETQRYIKSMESKINKMKETILDLS
jgi:hypothetical protein